MDDLDHSIHIAEDDWTSFYEESEECSLLQPSLACLDDASLTDSEDLGNLSSAVSQSQQDSQQNPDADKDGDTSNAAECTEEESSNSSVPPNQPEDAATKSEEDFEVYPKCPAPVPEETGYSATNTLQTELLNKSAHLTKDGEVQPESEPLSCHQTGLNVNEPDITGRAVKEDVRSVSSRAEKERWFVTVNDNPARWRARPTSVKKKRRQKKPFERRHTCNTTQENSPENGVKLEMNENKPESQGRRESKSNQNQKSGSNPNYEHIVEVGIISESSQAALISDEEDNFPSLKLNTLKPMMKRSKSEPDSSALMAQDPLTHSQMENEECDELEDSAEFLSVYSYDSESYLSAEDCPETYAKAVGHSQPVYAISAFWDEMEKLTINDILQLRMNRCSSPRETGEATTPNVDESPTNHGPLVDTVEYNLSCSTPMDMSDTADSDYFTQADESKPDLSSCEFSTSDFEEEYWQFVGTSRNPSPDPHRKNKHKDFAGTLALPRQLTKSKSMQNIQTLNREDASLPALLGNDESSLFFSRCQSLAENTAFKLSDSLGTQIPLSFLSSIDFLDYQISYPEVFEYFFTEDKEKPIPIFSCSHPTVRELTLPKLDYVFLSANSDEVDDISPLRIVSHSFIQAHQHGSTVEAAVGGSASWKSLLSIRKIHFHDKGSIWCRGSGDWVFPVDFEKIPSRREDPGALVPSEGRVSPASSQLFRELEEQHFILETIQTTRHQGIFSTLKQSDMCLVCIAFASWVLRSSDPEAADAWKAGMIISEFIFLYQS
uniref:Uncharacterized protein n=1 Tax=Oreochromis aureus TaxID=47969 RepID=A0A668ST89_OREAU